MVGEKKKRMWRGNGPQHRWKHKMNPAHMVPKTVAHWLSPRTGSMMRGDCQSLTLNNLDVFVITIKTLPYLSETIKY